LNQRSRSSTWREIKEVLRMKSKLFFMVLWLTLVLVSYSLADVPHMISYQGKLTTASGGCLNDTVQMTFSIYPDTLGSLADWSETQTQVVVKEGIFNVLLGAVDTIPQAVFDGSTKYLGVQVESDLEMRPLKPIVSVAYAYRAGTADGEGGGGGWVDDGTVVRLEDSTDQVAIGTASPPSTPRLHIKGSELAYLGIDPSRADTVWYIGSHNNYGALAVHCGTPSSSWTLAYLHTNGDMNLAVTGGDVAIGSGIARAKLDVGGSEGGGSFGGTLAITNLNGYIDPGDVLGQLMFYGHDGGEQIGAEIKSSAVEEWTPGSSGGDLRFLTTAVGSSTPVERVIVSDDGDVGVGTTTPNGKLHVETHGLYSGYFTSDYVSNQTHVIHAEYTGTAPGVAVYGESTPSDGSGRGGYFVGGKSGLLGKVEPTGSDTYYGVTGSVSSFGGSGSNHGVHALADAGGTNYGVYALAYGAGSEETYGTYSFATNSSTGDAYGGYFSTTDNGTGTHYGVYAESRSEATGRNYGTYSYANNQTTGDCYAGYFVADDESTGVDTHTGLRADGQANSAATTYGVYGRGENVGSGTVRGGYFTAYSAGSGTHYGVVGYEAAGGGGAAVYASGDFAGTGAKYAVVKTGRGHRLLSCMESPEVWFEDFGEGKLLNGKAHVELDPLFLETVTINADHPMKVFVQLTSGEPMNVVVQKGLTGFEVVADDLTSMASFDWRIVAKRKGYENERLRETDVGYDDPTLYPELQAEIDREHEEEKQQYQLEREKRRQEEERRDEEQRQMEQDRLRQEGIEKR
jgi:hypothetical protein